MPDVPGGGTVAYVNADDHRYLADPAQREEGGTPAIVESIRAGLVFQLKEAVGHRRDPGARGALPAACAGCAGRTSRAIEILGNLDAERLSIVSFVVRAPSGKYLHHNFVVALLNDLFGIQSRGGCSCAGPYGHRLLGIDIEPSHEFEREITHGCEGIKPGWVRVNFNYFISEAVFDYIVEAVRLVARDGWRLLGEYRFDLARGLWRAPRRPRRAAAAAAPGQLRPGRGDAVTRTTTTRAPESDLAGYLRTARTLLAATARTGPLRCTGGRVRRLRAPALVRPAAGVPGAVGLTGRRTGTTPTSTRAGGPRQ